MANLFYVIGASGSGKDSLIQYVRLSMQQDVRVVFAHRYITRPANAGGENHIALTEQEFYTRQALGCFALHWYSHNTWYGIGIEINQWLAKGINVVVNGSRAHLERATEKYSELCPVLISAHTDIIRRRLELRGRENMQQINQRLEQAIQLDKMVSQPGLIRIENNTSLDAAGQELIKTISDVKQQRCA